MTALSIASLLSLLACSADKDENAEPPSQTDTSEAEEVVLGLNPRIHRLTHKQWTNSVHSLLGIDASDIAENFQQSTLSEGFSNNGEVLSVDATLFQDYQRAAELLATQVVTNLEVYEQVVPEDPRTGGSTIAYSKRFEAESEDVVATTGGASGNRYNLWSNGTLSVEVTLSAAGTYIIRSLVQGTVCDDGLGADMEIRLDGDTLLSQTVTDPEEVTVEVELPIGTHIVSIAFTNDCYQPDDGFDRNLYIDWIEIEGGVDLGESVQTLEGMNPWVERFVSTAFRKPLTTEERTRWVTFFAQGEHLVQSGDAIADGVLVTVAAVLQSPDFLYRIERTPPSTELEPYELATKLSFQVCNAPPDDLMIEALANNEFVSNYRNHAERLLQSECGQENILQLHKELFHWDNYVNIEQPDEEWDAALNALFAEEMERFIAWHLFHEQGTVKGLYTADYTIANGRLAQLYGVDATSDEFERIELNPNERSGILTMLGPLSYKSDVGQSSPIHRGVFINDVILCKSLPPPPDVVPNLPAQDPTLTNRERVEAHTGEGTCGEGCHSALINPPGFAFEQYDELGRYRTEDGGLPIDASDEFYFVLDGLQSWQTGTEFTKLLVNSQEAHQCYTEHLFTYLLGRPTQEADATTIMDVFNNSMNDAPILSLVLDIVDSDSFRNRGAE